MVRNLLASSTAIRVNSSILPGCILLPSMGSKTLLKFSVSEKMSVEKL